MGVSRWLQTWLRCCLSVICFGVLGMRIFVAGLSWFAGRGLWRGLIGRGCSGRDGLLGNWCSRCGGLRVMRPAVAWEEWVAPLRVVARELAIPRRVAVQGPVAPQLRATLRGRAALPRVG